MKVVIASLGRAHLLDCARELVNQGNDVTMFCSTHRNSFEKYGLTKGGVNLVYYSYPFYWLKQHIHADWAMYLYRIIMDCLVWILMPKCDVFIAQSPNYRYSMSKAKKKYNAITILDRGEAHVEHFNKLMLLYSDKIKSTTAVNYDSKQYDAVDYITVPSNFVRDGFLKYGFSLDKIFLNPYGVSLSHFHSTVCTGEYDVIYVGNWSKLKGAQKIVEAFAGSGINFLHVGALVSLPFPSLSNFTHVDPVPEYKLIDYYRKSKCFLFPSYNDGFGLVLCQAAACGLPIVCSKNCGGSSLKELIHDEKYIYLLDNITCDNIKAGISIAMGQFEQGIKRDYVNDYIDNFSWKGYGERYQSFLKSIKK